MLVLSRKRGEQLVIPSCELTVTILEVKGKNVRLGISAPADLDVYRHEIWQRISSVAGRTPQENFGETR